MKNLVKIDRFYLVLGLILIVLAVFIIYTARTIFYSLDTAGTVTPELYTSTTPRINKSDLDKAIEKIDSKELVPLDL